MPRRSAKRHARGLRNNATDTERYLWRYLRRRHISGFKFRRQVSIGPYIVDFVSFEAQVIVELDGGQHTEAQAYDTRREAWLNTQGYCILRFWNDQVFNETSEVLEVIRQACLTPTPTFPQGEPVREVHRLAPFSLWEKGWG